MMAQWPMAMAASKLIQVEAFSDVFGMCGITFFFLFREELLKVQDQAWMDWDPLGAPILMTLGFPENQVEHGTTCCH
jgi:hypothetical protein